MNLEMCNECLNYKVLNKHGRCKECEKKELKNKMNENLTIANIRGFNDKVIRLTVEEIELIINSL